MRFDFFANINFRGLYPILVRKEALDTCNMVVSKGCAKFKGLVTPNIYIMPFCSGQNFKKKNLSQFKIQMSENSN